MDNAPSRDHRLSNKKSVPDKGSLPSSCESRGYKRSSEHYRFAIAFVGLLELEGRTLSPITLPSLITGLRGIRGSWPEGLLPKGWFSKCQEEILQTAGEESDHNPLQL